MSRILYPLFAMLLLGGGMFSLVPQEGAAQAPPSVEQVRERIRVLRGGPEASPAASAEAVRPADLARPPARAAGGITERELRQFEERLIRRVRDIVRRQLALDRDQARLDERERERSTRPESLSPAPAPNIFQYYYPPSVAETTGAAPAPPPAPDTSRPAPDTSGAAPPAASPDSIQQPMSPPPDTVMQTRVVQVRRSFLEAGLFRGFEVNFRVGDSTLLPRAERSLDAVGQVLQQYPALRLEIAGHTDDTGREASNQALSEARAEAVREYLVDRFAITSDRLEARGYGESSPIASNDAPMGRELNRRVEFVVLNPEDAERILDSTDASEEE